MQRFSVSQLAYGRKPENRVSAALYVHRETEKAFQVSCNGEPPKAAEKWLPKSRMIVHQNSRQPFIVASVPTALLTKKQIFYWSRELWPGREWSDEDKLAFDWAQALAAKERLSEGRRRMGRSETHSYHGRNFYA